MAGGVAAILRLLAIASLLLYTLPRAVIDWWTLLFLNGDNDTFEEFTAFTVPPLLGAIALYALAPWFGRLVAGKVTGGEFHLTGREAERVGLLLIGVVAVLTTIPAVFEAISMFLFPGPFVEMDEGATGRVALYAVGRLAQLGVGMALILLSRQISPK